MILVYKIHLTNNTKTLPLFIYRKQYLKVEQNGQIYLQF